MAWQLVITGIDFYRMQQPDVTFLFALVGFSYMSRLREHLLRRSISANDSIGGIPAQTLLSSRRTHPVCSP
jgi:hypothetical protein